MKQGELRRKKKSSPLKKVGAPRIYGDDGVRSLTARFPLKTSVEVEKEAKVRGVSRAHMINIIVSEYFGREITGKKKRKSKNE